MKVNALDYPQSHSSSASPLIARSLRIVTAYVLLPHSFGLTRAAISGRFIQIGSLLTPPKLCSTPNSELMCPRIYSYD